jgi:hypothetical protein
VDDLHDPALRELAEAVARDDADVHRLWSRVAAADVAIAQAMSDMPVPADLADRLLVALKAAEQGEPHDLSALRPAATAQSAFQQSSPPTRPADQITTTRKRVTSRRVWIGSGIAAAVAAAAAIALVLYPWPPKHVTPEEVAQQVQMLYDAEIAQAQAGDWFKGIPVYDEPVLSLGVVPQPWRWRELTVDGYDGRAYDVSQGRTRATLVVIDRRVRGLNDAPPHTPIHTHGRCIGVWQSESQVYALVIEGTLDKYQQLVMPGTFT